MGTFLPPRLDARGLAKILAYTSSKYSNYKYATVCLITCIYQKHSFKVCLH